MGISIKDLGDISGRFDISEEEAELIAETVNTEQEFVKVWENDNWWKDDVILTLDMDKWPETWEVIKARLKNPEKQIADGWAEAISGKIDDPRKPIEFVDYELSQFETISGNPEIVQIPVEYV